MASPASRRSGVMSLRSTQIAVAVAAALVAACGAASTDDRSVNTTPGPVGFPRQVLLVSSQDAEASGSLPLERCVWVASTAEQRRQGLMNVDSMGGADGMVFVQDQPTSGAFWMKDTFLPLSIAFFGGDGLFIDAVDMAPCMSESDSDCLRYPNPSNYLLALEVHQGELQRFGVGEGSAVALNDRSCSASTIE
ncbi:MAG: DUF192 domain-containing protein [Actinomycetota bacterium]|nr:DUF192 domain-containing protein [Actinomycetota bacterium]